MITVTINNKKFNCPENWDEISFETFANLWQTQKETDLNDSWLVAILTGCSHKDVREWDDVDAYIELVDKLKGFAVMPEWDNKPGVITWKGKKLDVGGVEKMPVQLYEDMKMLIVNQVDTEDSEIELWPRLASMWIQYKLGSYDYDKSQELAGEVKKLPAKEIMSLGNFFLRKLLDGRSGTQKGWLRFSLSQGERFKMFLKNMISCFLIGVIFTM